MCTVHRHNKKGSTGGLLQSTLQDASTLQLDLVSTCHRSASSDCVFVRSLLQAKPLRSYMAQADSVPLKLSSDLPSRFSKPNAATCVHIVAWSRCFVPRSLGFSEQNLLLRDVFLEPQRSCLQVSDLAHAPPRSNSTCCGSVTCHVSSQISAQANDSVGQSVPLAFV